MCTELLMIPSHLAIAWENLDTLRIGFDESRLRLHNPTPSVQRFVERLREGIRRDKLTLVAGHCGLQSHEIDGVLEQLDAVLHMSDHHPGLCAEASTVIGVLEEAHRSPSGLLAMMSDLGHPIAHNVSHADVVLVVERFRRPAEHAHELLQSDIPHLVVRFSDQSVSIGPLVTGQHSPCLACIELTEQQNHPEMAILAAQMVMRTPATEHPKALSFVAATLAAMLSAGIPNHLAGRRIVFTANGAGIDPIASVEQFDAHEECNCTIRQTHSDTLPQFRAV